MSDWRHTITPDGREASFHGGLTGFISWQRLCQEVLRSELRPGEVIRLVVVDGQGLTLVVDRTEVAP